MKLKTLFTILLVSIVCSIVVPLVFVFSIKSFESKEQKKRNDDYNKIVNSIGICSYDEKNFMEVQESLRKMTRFSDSITTVILLQEIKAKYPKYGISK